MVQIHSPRPIFSLGLKNKTENFYAHLRSRQWREKNRKTPALRNTEGPGTRKNKTSHSAFNQSATVRETNRLAFRCAWSRVRRLCKRFFVSRNEIPHPLWQFRLIKVSSRCKVGENQLNT